jgi:hypothetical protein
MYGILFFFFVKHKKFLRNFGAFLKVSSVRRHLNIIVILNIIFEFRFGDETWDFVSSADFFNCGIICQERIVNELKIAITEYHQ